MLLHLLDRLAFRASEQVIGVIAFVAVEFSARKLDHARRDAIEKIAVVRHEKAGAGIARQEILEPFDRAGVEVVRRLVEDQKIGTREQRAAKRDPAFFSAGKTGHDPFRLRRMQIRDQTLDPMLEIPAIEMRDLVEQDSAPRAFGRREFVLRDQIQNALRAGEDVGMHRRLLIELEHLRHVTDDEIAPLIELARVRLHHARRDLQKSRFARAVASDQADAFALQNRHRRVIEHDLIAKAHDEFRRAGNGI